MLPLSALLSPLPFSLFGVGASSFHSMFVSIVVFLSVNIQSFPSSHVLITTSSVFLRFQSRFSNFLDMLFSLHICCLVGTYLILSVIKYNVNAYLYLSVAANAVDNLTAYIDGLTDQPPTVPKDDEEVTTCVLVDITQFQTNRLNNFLYCLVFCPICYDDNMHVY